MATLAPAFGAVAAVVALGAGIGVGLTSGPETMRADTFKYPTVGKRPAVPKVTAPKKPARQLRGWAVRSPEQALAGQAVFTGLHQGGGRPPVYLTFDDGPLPGATDAILDVLKARKAPATFFVVGYRLDTPQADALLTRMRQENHSIGNHTWNHPDLRHRTEGTVSEEISSTDVRIRQLAGASPVCMRPPYGAYNSTVNAVAAQAGEQLTLWDVDTRDWDGRGPERIIDEALKAAHPGAIILMHDGSANSAATAAALPAIIDGLRGEGFRLAPMCVPVSTP